MTKRYNRRLFGAAGLMLAGYAGVPLASQVPSSKPQAASASGFSHLLGFPLYLSRYDSHWMWWLPRHPKFEMAEVMSAARPGGPPVVWVFFTERAGGKRQHHYINDARLAASLGWTYSEIRYETRGAKGQAQDLAVSLTDADGQPVEMAMEFKPGTPLGRTGSRGLTNQSGHSADTVFMTFYRDTRADAQSGTMKIGGVNYAFLPNEPLGGYPTRYANSDNIYIGITVYGRQLVPAGANVEPRPGGGATHSRRTRGGVLSTLTYDGANALTETRQSVGRASMFASYSPALASCGMRTTPTKSRFSISIDSDRDLIVGEATRRCDRGGSVIEYRPTSPKWASAQPFSVRQEPSADGGGILLTTRKLLR